MEFLSAAETLAWWPRHVPQQSAGQVSRALDANFEVGGSELHAANQAAGWLLGAGDGRVMAEVREHGVWPNSENLHLYYAWRRSHGDTRMLEAAPGHLFLRDDRADLVTLLHLGLLFGWGIWCAAPETGRVFWFDHDGRAAAMGKDQGPLEALASVWRK